VGKLFTIEYSFTPSTSSAVEISTDEIRTELIFKQNSQSFGDLLSGSGKTSKYSALFHTKEFSVPLFIKYSFEELTLSGIGHFESWPFTSLAASIINNRLNYEVQGSVKHHSLTATSAFPFASSFLFVTASYHRVLPDVVLEHWEPEFLVFGMKNFTRDPFSIKDSRLASIELRYEFKFLSANISLFGEQYIPLSISYGKPERAPAPNQPPVPTSTRKISTDGGRRFGIQLAMNL